jgi:hypothetical protein
MTPSTTAALHNEGLREALPSAIDMLRRRRCSEIPSGHIDDYVALDWFEWHGGGLRVTQVGENVCRQVVAQQAAPAAAGPAVRPSAAPR